VIKAYLREQPLEFEPVLDAGPALALIFVDDEDAFGLPTEFDSPVHQRILTFR